MGFWDERRGGSREGLDVFWFLESVCAFRFCWVVDVFFGFNVSGIGKGEVSEELE